MASRRTPNLPGNLVTPFDVYRRRREFLRDMGLFGVAMAGLPLAGCLRGEPAAAAAGSPPLPSPGLAPRPGNLEALSGLVATSHKVDDDLTDYADATTYNNYYEFGVEKDEPAKNAHTLEPRPWEVAVGGLCDKPGTLDVDAIISPHTLEERVYRHRCVEAWSMVIPWAGVPLGPVLERFEPRPEARFVSFTTLWDTKQMPKTAGRFPVLDWPYIEGLRLDEAMHPLAFLAVGMYGEILPNQNGAPLRLVVPWKYGFKGAKSIVRIQFTDKMPLTAWVNANAREYGFYSNVNPNRDHPRWSQGRERVIGGFGRRRTELFNGYDEVASLYSGMDLKRNF